MTFLTDIINFIVSLFVPTAEVGIFTWFLRLIGLPFCFVVMLAGCQGSGDGGQMTLTDFLEAADRHEIKYRLDIELDRPGSVATKQSVEIDTGFRANGEISGQGSRANLAGPTE